MLQLTKEEELRNILNKETLRVLEKQRRDLDVWLEEEIAKLRKNEEAKS